MIIVFVSKKKLKFKRTREIERIVSMSTLYKMKEEVDVVEVTFAVPKEQSNILKQMGMKYILENNNEEVAHKLLGFTNTKLRSDIKFWSTRNIK